MNNQLDRLKMDAIQLDDYINKVTKRGDERLIKKLSAKKVYLLSHIEYVEQNIMQREPCLITS